MFVQLEQQSQECAVRPVLADWHPDSEIVTMRQRIPPFVWSTPTFQLSTADPIVWAVYTTLPA